MFKSLHNKNFIPSKLENYGKSLIKDDKKYIKKLLIQSEYSEIESKHIYFLMKRMFFGDNFTHNKIIFNYISDLIQNISSTSTDNIELVIELLSLHKQYIHISGHTIDLLKLTHIQKYIIGAVLKEYNNYTNQRVENLNVYFYLVILTLGLINNKYKKNDWKSRFVARFNTDVLEFVSKIKYDNVHSAQLYYDTKVFGSQSDITKFIIGQDKKKQLNSFFKTSKVIKHQLLKDYEVSDKITLNRGKKKVYISLYDNIIKNLKITRNQFRTFMTMLLDIDDNFSFSNEFTKSVEHKLKNTKSKKDKEVLNKYMSLYKDYDNNIKINVKALKTDFFKYIDELWEHNKIKEFDKYNDIVYFINTITKEECLYKIGKNGRIYTTGNTLWAISNKVIGKYLNHKDQQVYDVDLTSSIVNIIRHDLGLGFIKNAYGDGTYKDEIKMLIMYMLNGRKRDLRKLLPTISSPKNGLNKIFKQINPALKVEQMEEITSFIIRNHNYINVLADSPKKEKEKLIYKYLKEEVNIIIDSLMEFKKLRPNRPFVYKFDGVLLFNADDSKLFSELLKQTSKNIYGDIFPFTECRL